MRIKIRYFTTLFAAAGACAAIVLAPVAAAAPECVNTAPMTTLCETNGSAQLTTSPQLTNNWGWGWPWGGGFVIGFGGFGW
jgi:hypothetical protein